jgi:hypothetical protein
MAPTLICFSPAENALQAKRTGLSVTIVTSMMQGCQPQGETSSDSQQGWPATVTGLRLEG